MSTKSDKVTIWDIKEETATKLILEIKSATKIIVAIDLDLAFIVLTKTESGKFSSHVELSISQVDKLVLENAPTGVAHLALASLAFITTEGEKFVIIWEGKLSDIEPLAMKISSILHKNVENHFLPHGASRKQSEFPLTRDKVEVVDEKLELGKRLSILIHAILFISITLLVLFTIQGILGNYSWKNLIWPFFLADAVFVGLIYNLDVKNLPSKKSIKRYSSASSISGLVLTLGLGISAIQLTIISLDVSGILLLFTVPFALICFIVAILILSDLGKST